MNMKKILVLFFVFLLSGCAIAPAPVCAPGYVAQYNLVTGQTICEAYSPTYYYGGYVYGPRYRYYR